jgi:hypothetical protein
MPSKRKEIVSDPIDAPPRPAYAKNGTREATLRSGSVENALLSYEGPVTDEALSEIADALFCALDAEESADGGL